MSLEPLIQSLKDKIIKIEDAIEKTKTTITQATNNYNGLLGMLQNTKETLAYAEKILSEPPLANHDNLVGISTAANS